ncbi:MAG: enoyl-CoA hydratase-related protein [Bacteroidota bacterium]|nr:enoyl-CoA hydratase-related protein [Bacteroidota bacterium]
MPFENLLIEIKGRIQYIIINRESKLNALNKATLAELHAAFSEAFKNPVVGGIIITGAGQKAFAAGADIAEFVDAGAGGGREIAAKGQETVIDFIENGTKPVIAAINGFALGGGLELAMACHIRIASENVKMGLPEVSLGLIPGYGGTQRLPRLIGKGRAMEMIMTAEMIGASEAWQYGLVNHVVSQNELLDKAEEILDKILSRAPLAITSAIKAINASFHPDGNGFELEINEFSKCFGTKDIKEGISAFLQKRKPEFKGE